MKNLRSKNSSGYTLVEMMVALSIFTVVMGGIYTIFLVGNKSWMTFTSNVIVQHNLRQGMQVMAKELRRARNVFVTEEPGGVRVNFLRYPVGLVSYTWSEQGEDAYKIIRQNNINKKVIAGNIQKFDLELLSDSIIIDMASNSKLQSAKSETAENSEAVEESQFKLKGKIALRSKVYETKKQ